MVDNDAKSGQIRGQRLVKLRELLKLTRTQFAETFGFHYNTIFGWEELKNSQGINERAAIRISRAVESSGCIVTPEWLLEGKGSPPYLRIITVDPPINTFHYRTSGNTVAEIVNFAVERLGSDCVSFTVSDNAMSPSLNRGDMIVGFPIEKAFWYKHFQQYERPALVKMHDDSMMVRKLSIRDTGDIYLSPSNALYDLSDAFVDKAKVEVAYDIVLHISYGLYGN